MMNPSEHIPQEVIIRQLSPSLPTMISVSSSESVLMVQFSSSMSEVMSGFMGSR
jgi:hypothetical protein